MKKGPHNAKKQEIIPVQHSKSHNPGFRHQILQLGLGLVRILRDDFVGSQIQSCWFECLGELVVCRVYSLTVEGGMELSEGEKFV